MLNKIFLLLLFFLSVTLNAQEIKLQKNNMYSALTIDLPKKMHVIYNKDGSIKKIKAKAIDYSFPYLTVLKKKDTIRIDVRNIIGINYHPAVAPLYYLMLFPVTLFSVAFTGVAFADPVESGFIVPFIFGTGLGYLDYYLFTHANRKLDTKTKWSFY